MIFRSQDGLPSPNIEHVMRPRSIPENQQEKNDESVEKDIAQVKIDEPLPPKTDEKLAKPVGEPAKKKKRKRVPQSSNNNSDEEVSKTQTTITDHFMVRPLLSAFTSHCTFSIR